MYKLGIVGFGIVGKSVLAFLNRQKIDYSTASSSEHDLFDDSSDVGRIHVSVWDARALGFAEQEIVKIYKATAVDASMFSLREFIQNNDFIIASPGIDLSDYQDLSNKFLCELDFFSAFFTKPVIAVTGSLGKTTMVKLLGSLISAVPICPVMKLPEQQLAKPIIGGNVGIGMLDLIHQLDACDLGIIELSSFQLELSKKFAPDVAVWTNWYPNHLDRHHTAQAYFDAKFNLLRFQQGNQVAILSDTLFAGQSGAWLNEQLVEVASHICICTVSSLTPEIITIIKRAHFDVVHVTDACVVKSSIINGQVASSHILMRTDELPPITFLHNWVQALAVMSCMGASWASCAQCITERANTLLPGLHHRLEYFSTIGGVDFYDDSKSTVVQSTLAAFQRLAEHGRPIILIVGGLGKGVDRSLLATTLKDHPQLKRMYCFGKECAVFGSCDVCENLDETLHHVERTMSSGDIVLFSPSGTSFDFFKNYEHRGQVFRELVEKLGNRVAK
jgi:UDP-N-acetylmuramoylalanine--D-glutamate ligase